MSKVNLELFMENNLCVLIKGTPEENPDFVDSQVNWSFEKDEEIPNFVNRISNPSTIEKAFIAMDIYARDILSFNYTIKYSVVKDE